ncbi:MAG: two-component system, OmpR family, sensor histidine kinase KdpD [Gammaproteobacteria bacterium]|jgi:two-component system sensor histidine kinase KdpD|nr:two-component system, OmpR family, sensor histidine kinase KdpD [Gammaproteobacteria bacterium]
MPTLSEQRRDPDLLLAKVKRQEAEARRGKLRIYFGSSAGVGKTYAMLVAARKLEAEGRDIVIGVAETHGRSETAALLADMEILPPKPMPYRGKELSEFDLDAALLRRPSLILVDELAHSNVQGARHPKRWQDIGELLAAGIDVFTTLNVQHLESLNDVVGGITNVRVWETVPDTVFDDADEVVLVDIPADELLERLKAGKVYMPHQAERAANNFFRKGNLMALRELALRRTADRVEGDVQAYRVEKSIEPVWKTANALLTCVGPDAGAERVVRAAARLAGQLNAEWHAVYVETPGLQRLPAARREKILWTLSLAKELGATTAVIADADVATSVVDYARSHNLSKLVIGRDPARRLWPWQRSSGQKLAWLAPDIDLIEIGRADGVMQNGEARSSSWPATPGAESGDRRRFKRLRYLWGAFACVAVTLLSMPLAAHFDRSNIVAIYILTVVLIAVRFGRGPAAFAAVLSVCAFDFFFVPPRFSFAVSDVQYFLTFFIMLAVGLITGQLTAGLRFQARVAGHREERAGSLYEIARDLSGAVQIDQVVSISDASIERTFRAAAALLLPNAAGQLAETSSRSDAALTVDIGIAQWAFDKGQPAGFGTDTLPGSEVLYIPLRAPIRARGVLAVKARNRRLLRIPEQRQLLDTFAALIAIALERVHYVGVAQDAVVRMESERLRNSLLAALSHDLRTPLTVLVGLAESLTLTKPPLSAAQLESAEAIQDEARRMSTLVSNLLDMARIESGEVKLNLQWQPLEEVVGSALNATHGMLKQHTVEVHIPRDLPLVRIDALLIERVLVNLLENASKYTPVGSRITLAAEVIEDQLSVSVSDDGPGLTVGREEAVFQKFTRGERESATPGVGLGLAICRAIVESHQGKIIATHRPGGGARFTFTLPLGHPPAAAEETEAAHG